MSIDIKFLHIHILETKRDRYFHSYTHIESEVEALEYIKDFGWPMVSSDTYDEPISECTYFPIEGDRETRVPLNLTIMRGSKKGIGTRLGKRTYEYDYAFASKLGAYVGRKLKDKTVFSIRSKRNILEDMVDWDPGHFADKCWWREFNSAYRWGKAPDTENIQRWVRRTDWSENIIVVSQPDGYWLNIFFNTPVDMPSDTWFAIEGLKDKVRNIDYQIQAVNAAP